MADVDELMALGMQAYLAQKVVDLRDSGARSLTEMSAIPDGDDLKAPYDNYLNINAALQQGGTWSGDGGVYALGGQLIPQPANRTRPLILKDMTFVQLTPGLDSIYTLWLLKLRGAQLHNVWVRRHMDTIDCTGQVYDVNSAWESRGGIRIDQCSQIFCNRSGVEGDGGGVLMHVLYTTDITHFMPDIRDAQYHSPTDPVDEPLKGMIHSACSKVRILLGSIGNMTSRIDTILGGISTGYNADCCDFFRGCHDVEVIGTRIFNGGDGIDLANATVTRRHENIRFVGIQFESMNGTGIKLIYDCQDVVIDRCWVRGVGNVGFALSGPSVAAQVQRGSRDVTITNCGGTMIGTPPLSRDPASGDRSLLKIIGDTAPSGLVVDNLRGESDISDCEYKANKQICLWNFVTFEGRSYQAQPDDWAPLTAYPAGIVKSCNGWLNTCQLDHISSAAPTVDGVNAGRGFRGDKRAGLWFPEARTGPPNTPASPTLSPPRHGTYVATLARSAPGSGYNAPYLVFDMPGVPAGGMRATGTISQSGGALNNDAALTGCGLGYIINPSVMVTDGIGSATRTAAGTGYVKPSLHFGPPFGSFTLTGDTTLGSTVISNPSMVPLWIEVGTALAGAGIPSGTTVLAVTEARIVMSRKATATATGITVTIESGLRPTAVGQLSSGGLGSTITMTRSGGGYLSPAALAVGDGVVITRTAAGSGYIKPVAFAALPNIAAQGVQAISAGTLSGSTVASFDPTPLGAGYTGTAPAVQVGDGVALSLGVGGTSYHRPFVVIPPPDIDGGTQAAWHAVLAADYSGTVIALVEDVAGTGYLAGGNLVSSPPSIIDLLHVGSGATVICSTPGSGATATASTPGTGATATAGSTGSGGAVMATVSSDLTLSKRDDAQIMWTFTGPDYVCKRMTAVAIMGTTTAANPGDVEINNLKGRGMTSGSLVSNANFVNTGLWFNSYKTVPNVNTVLIGQGLLNQPAFSTSMGLSGLLSIIGEIAYPRLTGPALALGLNSNLVLPGGSHYNFASPGVGAFSIDGFVYDGSERQWKGLFDATAGQLTIVNQGAGSSAGNKIYAGSGADRVLVTGHRYWLEFFYEGALSSWLLVNVATVT